jgi:hypothetical protein
VLSADDEIMTWLEQETARTGQNLPEVVEGSRRIPIVLWARLHADLAPYLTERVVEGATVLTFYHRQFEEAARETYLTDGLSEQLHATLAQHFRSTVDPVGDGTWRGHDLRGLSELPYHLTEAGDWEGVERLLTDFRFIERKVAEVGIVHQTDGAGNPATFYTGVHRLRDDFDHALQQMDAGSVDPRRRVIVTAVDLGDGLGIRCPHCGGTVPWQEEYRGRNMICPACDGPWKVSAFVVGERE